MKLIDFLPLLNESESGIYLHGRCHIWALAAHHVTNWPMIALFDEEAWIDNEIGLALVHMVVRDPRGNLHDASGIITENEFLNNYGDCNSPDQREISEDDWKQMVRDKFLERPKSGEIKKLRTEIESSLYHGLNESTDRILHDASPQQLKGLANLAQGLSVFRVLERGGITNGSIWAVNEAKPFDSFGEKKAGHLYDFSDDDLKGIGFWLNPATKEYATVPWDAVEDETHHVDVLLGHPERFGISKKLLKQYIKDIGGFGTDDAIGIGLASGWVRINLVQGIQNETNIDARKPLEARAALRWVLAHYPNVNVANITIWPFKFTNPRSSVDVNSVIDPKSFQIGQSQFHAYVERGIIGRSI